MDVLTQTHFGKIPNKAQAYEKKMAILFWYAQQQNPYNLLKKTSVFVFIFHVVVLVLLAKQQQQKIVNLNMISVCYAWALIPSYR
jgi:hypothetical protein